MNDYLGNLAARSLGLVPVARPRLAARFEPGASGISPHGALAATHDFVASADLPTTPARPQAFRSVQQAPIAASTDDTIRTRTRSTSPSLDHEFSDPVVGAAAEHHAPSAAPVAVNPSFAPRFITPVEGHPLQTHATLPATEHTVAAGAMTDQDRRASDDRPPLSADPELGRWGEIEERLSVLERGQGHPRSSTDPGARPVVPVDSPVPIDHPREATAPPGETTMAAIVAPESTRTVHVTIGRVDVRAIVPPAASPRTRARPAASGSSVSLEDYLKHRSGP